jgi:hypothetical protein
MDTRQKALVNLKKREDTAAQIKIDIKSKVGLVLDVSGSMKHLFKNGLVQEIIERIFPLARKFDDDGLLDLWIFSNGSSQMSNVSIDNFHDYVEKEIINKKPSCLWGGTEYAPVMRKVTKFYSGGIFSKAKEAYVIYITDGENNRNDKPETIKIITEASYKPIFWQYVGIGNSDFEFLNKLDDLDNRFVDNANFFQLNDIAKIDDLELYKRLLKEFPDWIELARVKKIID